MADNDEISNAEIRDEISEVINFLSENEQYGDDWGSAIDALWVVVDKLYNEERKSTKPMIAGITKEDVDLYLNSNIELDKLDPKQLETAYSKVNEGANEWIGPELNSVLDMCLADFLKEIQEKSISVDSYAKDAGKQVEQVNEGHEVSENKGKNER